MKAKRITKEIAQKPRVVCWYCDNEATGDHVTYSDMQVRFHIERRNICMICSKKKLEERQQHQADFDVFKAAGCQHTEENPCYSAMGDDYEQCEFCEWHASSPDDARILDFLN